MEDYDYDGLLEAADQERKAAKESPSQPIALGLLGASSEEEASDGSTDNATS